MKLLALPEAIRVGSEFKVGFFSGCKRRMNKRVIPTEIVSTAIGLVIEVEIVNGVTPTLIYPSPSSGVLQ